MMKHKFLIGGLALVSLMSNFRAEADIVARYPMDIKNGRVSETICGKSWAVEGHFAPESVAGAVGDAVRFDGYTSVVNAEIGNVLSGAANFTVSVWVATPSYPIIKIDEATSERVGIVNCLNDGARSGFAIFLGYDGKYTFKTYIGGWPVEIIANDVLPTYQWCNIVAVLDGNSRKLSLYNNGKLVGQSNASGTVDFKANSLTMGMGPGNNTFGPFQLVAFNGIIDDLCIYNNALSTSEISAARAENALDLDIPASRFASQVLRPRFHGMPAAGWTNECHGMAYSDGRYHLFFQKNADGPYMARLHWGHISSENLYDWREEKIAIAPGNSYDIKGCWSGCVFTDNELTGNLPAAIYTGVDYARATIDMAKPASSDLLTWNKVAANPIINGRPNGLSDDFRDPYFFRHNGNAYIIVGSSKNGVGTTTLHKYDSGSKTWSNTGDIFFTGASTQTAGTFWEMPNITPMSNGKWLFTATPLGLPSGVRTLYWVGNIDANGHFMADASFTIPKQVELISREGFGLLSPTIFNHDGKTIALGIVPDKLSSNDNWNLGWAHCYSLPREWSLDNNGDLIQKPYSGLQGMRSSTKYSRSNFELNGTENLNPVEGRQYEICGEFEVGSIPFGYRIFDNGNQSGTILYNPGSNMLTMDFSRLTRLVNDGGVYDGKYSCSLPDFIKQGSVLKLNVFVDGSIVDIFINDKWATSIRVFPTDASASGVSAYSIGGNVKVKNLNAWKLDASSFSGIDNFTFEETPENNIKEYYTLNGLKVNSDFLAPGIYICKNNNKVEKVVIH